ncbi:MAG: tRNA (adenosine(37)-N6)-dimethylallyltransferase MiaA, partial [Candidatus Paceibacterales bacterium]
ILGPTAVGKTDLAIKLAKKFNGEIISADSRQIYKGMTIGTAKPKRETGDRRQETSRYVVSGIPHHLIDIIYPDENFNVAVYKKRALKVIRDIQKRGKLPFLVGGTGLYIQAIVDNIIFPKVPSRKRMRKELEAKTEKELFKIYKKLDPEGAKFIEKENKRRLIRAIEVCKVTKKSFWKQRKRGEPLFNTLQIGIKLPEKELKKRISKRVEKMFKLGLEKEAKNLIKKYKGAYSLQTIGYQEWSDYFEDKIDKNKVKENIKLHTLQFARRQMAWFKRDKGIYWIKNYREAEKLIKK